MHNTMLARPTIANGLAVPKPIGESLMLRVLVGSKGTAVGITEEEIIIDLRELGKLEGLFVAPEGVAIWMAARKLLATGYILPKEQVLLLNMGSGEKHMENIESKYKS